MALNPAGHVIEHLKAHEMPDEEIAKRIGYSAHTESALHALLQKPDLDRHDVMMFLAEAVQKGMISGDELMQIAQHLPKHPDHVRHVVKDYHQVAAHAGTMLKAEQFHRSQGGK